MVMTWEGGFNEPIKEKCTYCNKEIDILLIDEYDIDNGRKYTCKSCSSESAKIENRNILIDSIIDKKWWQFWK